MKTLSNDELQRIYIEQDMLRGNISRMCTTDDEDEFKIMYESAFSRLFRIYEINYDRFREAESEVKA